MSRIYLDHNASSPLRPVAREAMLRVLQSPAGNPSSPHAFGRAARMAIEDAREQVARLLGALTEEIVLTGGGTESNNLAIYGVARAGGAAGRRIVTSLFEHPSVLGPMDDLERDGFEVVRLPPTRAGLMQAEEVLRAAPEGTALVSLMLANNEVGTVQPIAAIGRELRRRGILFHCDAAQGVGKLPIDVGELQVDLLSIAGHKFGAPQGAGALFVRQGLAIRPHLRGGGQELNRRPGTESVAAFAGLGAAAAEALAEGAAGARRLATLRDRLECAVLERGLGSRVNGQSAARVPNTSSLAFEGATGEALVMALDLEGIAVSAGSACSAGTVRRSHVLEAMGLREESACSIRVSLGPATTEAEIDAFVGALERVVGRVRSAAERVISGGRV
ncbi:MAG: hypothetical protein AUI47_05225 [Acidobacteria bacterium 13_1_40CM_2_68_5]|nr:MAG: hypothetical protein AUI47_05225 [Acidobacteria bacterium 13_1_40CM_2_68_5]OLE67868.1 MAG: hypothetical protein AUG09_00340 [Acidobacteria bacterium 13_1_20CM_2_68_7]